MRKINMDIPTPEDDRALRQALGVGTPLNNTPRPFLPSSFLLVNLIFAESMGLLPAIVLQNLIDIEEEYILHDPKAEELGYFTRDIEYLADNSYIPVKEVRLIEKQLIERGYLIKLKETKGKNGSLIEWFTLPDNFKIRE